MNTFDESGLSKDLFNIHNGDVLLSLCGEKPGPPGVIPYLRAD